MSGLVIASHLPGEGHFRSDRFDVVGVECRDDFDYWAGVAEHWQSDRPLVLVEHDVEATDEHVAALLDCPHPLCSWPYRLHWVSCGRPDGVLSVLDVDGDWAGWSAIGLVKIAPDARTGPLRREPWQRVELAVHDAVTRPWHLHWPLVNHWHW